MTLGPRTQRRPPSATPSTGSNLYSDAGQELPGGAETRIERSIDGDAGAAFGRAVGLRGCASPNWRAQVLAVTSCNFSAAGKQQPQAAEIIGMAALRA